MHRVRPIKDDAYHQKLEDIVRYYPLQKQIRFLLAVSPETGKPEYFEILTITDYLAYIERYFPNFFPKDAELKREFIADVVARTTIYV